MNIKYSIFKIENSDRVESYGTFIENNIKQLADRLFNYSDEDLIRIQNLTGVMTIVGKVVPLSLDDKINLTSIDGIKFQLKNFSLSCGLIYYLHVTPETIQIQKESVRLSDYIDGWKWNVELYPRNKTCQ